MKKFILALMLITSFIISACDKLEQVPPTTLEMIKAFVFSDLGEQAMRRQLIFISGMEHIPSPSKEEANEVIKKFRESSDNDLLEVYKAFGKVKCTKVSDRYQCIGFILPVTPNTFYFSRDTSGQWMYLEQ